MKVACFALSSRAASRTSAKRAQGSKRTGIALNAFANFLGVTGGFSVCSPVWVAFRGVLECFAMTVNDPETVAELQALYPKYEAALVTNDVATLTGMFWASPHAMRFGVAENLYGIDEIEAFRKSRSAVNLARTVGRLDIVTFGKDYASVTLEFERRAADKKTRGRQSQVWVRLAEGWRIVSAHVSVLP